LLDLSLILSLDSVYFFCLSYRLDFPLRTFDLSFETIFSFDEILIQPNFSLISPKNQSNFIFQLLLPFILLIFYICNEINILFHYFKNNFNYLSPKNKLNIIKVAIVGGKHITPREIPLEMFY